MPIFKGQNISQLFRDINLFGFVLSLSIVAIFSRYLLMGTTRFRSPSGRAATALCVYFLGSAILHGAYLAVPITASGSLDWYSVVGGAIISAIGALCVVRVFASAYCTSHAWIFLAVMALGTALFFSAF